MAMTEEARHELHEALQAAIGKGPTVTLLESLPPMGWDDIATKHDLVLLKHDLALLKQDLVLLETRIQVDLHKEINSLFVRLLFAMLGFQLSFGGVVLGIIKLS